MDKIGELKKLKDLLDNEFISQEEFNSLKNEILGIDKSNQQKVETDLAPNGSIPINEDLKTTDNKEFNLTKIEENKKIIEKVEVKENILKCKKCDTIISDDFNRSNKELCLECKEKRAQIPKLAYLSLLLLVPLFWWIFKDSSTDEQPLKEQIEQTQVNNRVLTIKGNDIWVRERPKIGKVVLKLNDNNRVFVSDSCCYESIKGNSSYWYEIDYNGKSGWVFGSQTKEFTSTNIDLITNPKKLFSKIKANQKLAVFHGFGTEPFWDIYLTKDEVLYVENGKYTSFKLLTSFKPNATSQIIKFKDKNSNLFEFKIKKKPTGDGMSVKMYPYSVIFSEDKLYFNGAGE